MTISEISKNPISVMLMLAKIISNIEYYQNKLQLLYDSANLKENKFQQLTYFDLDFSLVEIYKFSRTAIEENYSTNSFLVYHNEFHYIRYNGNIVFDEYLEKLLPKRIKTEKLINKADFPEDFRNTEFITHDKKAFQFFIEKFDFRAYENYLKTSFNNVTSVWF